MPEMARFLFGLHFKVRQRGLQHRVPVHKALAPIDQPVFIQPNEYLKDGPGQALIKCETLGFPVQGCTQTPQLAGNGPAARLFPLPYALQELFAAKIGGSLALCGQLFRDNHLGGDTSVIGAHLP